MGTKALDEASLLKGLQALADSEFPKVCRTCRRVYRTPEEYAAATLPVRGGASGLRQAVDDDGRPILELYRNCVCGSTLMEFFNDRRDLSEAGCARRERFDRLVAEMVAGGFDRVTARGEILKVLRGEPTELLLRLGVWPPA